MEILKNVYNSLGVYFNALKQFGYKKESDTNKLLVYIFIENMLSGDMSFFLTEEDVRYIEQALSCLYGSSYLIKFPISPTDDTLFGRSISGVATPALSEDEILRLTESDILRFRSVNYNH